MAEDNCLTEDGKKWDSWLTPTGDSKMDDGKITITKESNKLKGKHEKSGADLEELECDGTNISFSRVETRKNGSRVRIYYKNGKISGPSGGVFTIDGKYREEVLPGPTDSGDTGPAQGSSRTAADPTLPLSDTGDWKAEKPTA